MRRMGIMGFLFIVSCGTWILYDGATSGMLVKSLPFAGAEFALAGVVAQTLINSAKVEVQFLEATGQNSRSEFMESDRLLEDAKPAAKRNGAA